jgi:hypothetical protein
MPIPGPFKGIFGGRLSPPGGPTNAGAAGAPAIPTRKAEDRESAITRPSRGLEEFFAYIRDETGLTLLDLGGATQQNVSFITGLGHRLYSEDFVQLLNETFGSDLAGQANPGRIEFFLRHTLDYPEAYFDGLLVWDVLEYLAPPLLAAVVARLRKIVRPNSYLLAFFHADDRVESVSMYTFRVLDVRTLQVAPYGTHRLAQIFNNRALERLFGGFASVKFFLARDRLREVVVKA